VKDSLRSIASVLEAGDVVSAVSWNTSSNVLLHEREVGGPDDPEVLAMIDGLDANGATDLSGVSARPTSSRATVTIRRASIA
jgi:hypothetical protein